MIPDSVTRYPIVNAIADPNHTPTTSWLARESGSGNQSPTGILTTSGVSRVSRGHYTRGRDTDAGVAGPYRGGRAGRPVALSTRIASNGFLPDPRCTPGRPHPPTSHRLVQTAKIFTCSSCRPLHARARYARWSRWPGLRLGAEGGALIECVTTTRTAKDGTVTTTVRERFTAPDWRADGWFLERRHPTDWSRRTELVLADHEQAAEADPLVGVHERGRSRHRPRNDPMLYGGPYPFIQTRDVKSAPFWISEAQQSYSEEGLAQSRLWPPGTVCVTIAANIAESAMLRIEACFPDSVIGVIAIEGVADSSYLKYAMDFMKLRLQAVSGGTTQDNLSLEKLLRFEFPAPPLELQARISKLLRAFDDLIDSNRRRIEILEEMARLLYREWFVQFRFPGADGVDLVESDLGEIPNAWEVERLGDVLTLNYGKALKADDRRGGEVAVYGSGGLVGWHDEALVEGPTIVVGRKGNVGSIYWSEFDAYPIDTTYFVDTSLPLRWSHQMLMTLTFIDSHAAIPGLSREQAYSIPIAVPSRELTDRYEELAKPLYDLGQCLTAQNVVLAEARDLLLPRLVSGELDVTELDLPLEAVS